MDIRDKTSIRESTIASVRMSFKLKRRVSELLANDIPDDEALLLKNGTYVCTVCGHRPVVSTVDMLVVHRRGKKHLKAANMRMKQKVWELQEKQKKEQEAALRTNNDENTQSYEEVQGANTSPLLEMTRKRVGHALLKEAPYNSTAARKRIKLPERQSLFFQQSKDVSLRREIEKQPSTESRNQTTARESHQASTANYVFPWNAGVSSRQQQRNSHPAVAQTAEKHKEHLHYIQLKQSGWLQDEQGKWYKDPEVEFDSDEEEPPPPT